MVNEINSSKLSYSKSIKKQKKTFEVATRPKFTKFLFEGVVYCIGDYLLLRETNKTSVVAHLLKIEPECL